MLFTGTGTMKRKALLIILSLCFLIISLCIGGCHQQQRQAEHSKIVVDGAGRQVPVPLRPQRIVSLNYGIDEIVTALVPAEQIVAYSRWAGDEEITFLTKEQAQKVGKRVQLTTEAIFSLRPDLVITSTATDRALVDSLSSLGVPVVMTINPTNYREMKLKVATVAQAVNREAEGRQLLEKMDRRLLALQEKLDQLPLEKRKTVVAFSFSGAFGRRGMLFNSLLEEARIINRAAVTLEDGTEAVIGKEQIVAVNPDIFLLPSWNYHKEADAVAYGRSIMEDPAFAHVKAVVNKQGLVISDRYRFVSSHHIIDAIEALAQGVYPELFTEVKKND